MSILQCINIQLKNKTEINIDLTQTLENIEKYLIKHHRLIKRRDKLFSEATTTTYNKHHIDIYLHRNKVYKGKEYIEIRLHKDKFKGNLSICYDNNIIDYETFITLFKTVGRKAYNLCGSDLFYIIDNFDNYEIRIRLIESANEKTRYTIEIIMCRDILQ